jgi:phospholipid/cholesterol/gamma-HCH transport system substrate-binding protein
MIGRTSLRRVLATGCCVVLTATGCAFHGLNSLPLPGTVGRESGASVFHVELANVGALESNSPVMIDDVVVGTVGKMTIKDRHADVEVFVQPTVVVPGNAVATIGQTSLLGSQHLALNPPLDQHPAGRLQSGSTIPLSKSSTYPSTEQTLSSLSLVVNAGGLGQFGDIVHNFNAALSGHQDAIRDLLSRLDTFVGMFNDQRDDIIALIRELNRFAATFAGQRDVLKRALRVIPPALDVLIKEEPRLTTALNKLGVFSRTATGLIHDTQADLVNNLRNLEPTMRALADVGPALDASLAYAPVFPYGQNFVDRAVRGDYLNFNTVIDLTVPRLKRELLLGTHWAQEGAELVPAPGDPGYDRFYATHPLMNGGTPASPPQDMAQSPPPQIPAEPCTLTAWVCTFPLQGPDGAPPAPPRQMFPPLDAQVFAPLDQGGS